MPGTDAPSIFVRDDLRASVEAATGGQCTVLYTAQGLPSYFFVLPKFRLEDIDASLGSGTHPAFIINGQEVSQIFIGMFQGLVKNDELLSLPQRIPTRYITLDEAATYARNCGEGWHLITNAEWAAIALWCQRNEWLPQGNDCWGLCQAAPWQTGVRSDGGNPGSSGGVGLTLTGSGPTSWRHNDQASGISDLAGNLEEWVAGIRLVEGELQIFPNNNAAGHLGSFHDATNWQAIRHSDGVLVAPGTAGSVKVDVGMAYAPADGGEAWSTPLTWSNQITQRQGEIGSTESGDALGGAFSDISSVIGPSLLKTLALAPYASTTRMGRVGARNYGTRLFSRGGSHLLAGSGVFSFAAMHIHTHEYYNVGRVAKY